MKMRSGREYKYDRSDIIGVLWEQEKIGEPLTLEMIKKAIVDLYDSYDVITFDVKRFVEQVIQNGDYKTLYKRVRQYENENKEYLIEYQEGKPNVINRDNISDILAALREKNKKIIENQIFPGKVR